MPTPSKTASKQAQKKTGTAAAKAAKGTAPATEAAARPSPGNVPSPPSGAAKKPRTPPPASSAAAPPAMDAANGVGAVRIADGVWLVNVPRGWLTPYTYKSGALAGQKMNPRTRFPEDELEAVRESIRAYGLFDRLRAHVPADAPPPETWSEDNHPTLELTDGEKRWIVSADLVDVLPVLPVEIRSYTDQEALRLARVTGTARSNLSFMDQVRSYAVEWEVAKEAGRKQADVARELLGPKAAQSTLSNLLRLLKLPAEVQDLLNDGLIPQGAAKDYLLPFAAREREGGAGLPADLSAVFFERLSGALQEALAAGSGEPLSGVAVRGAAAVVGRSMSLPIARGTGAFDDEPPLFTLEDHAAGCDCGAPVFGYVPNAAEHARCFRPEWCRKANSDAREALREAQRRQMDAARADLPPSAPSQPPPSVPQQYGCEGCNATDWSYRDPAAGVCDQCAPEHFAAEVPPVPAVAGAPYVATVAPQASNAAPALPAPLPSYVPGQVIPHADLRRWDDGGTWLLLGSRDATGHVVPTPRAGDLDLSRLDAEHLRYVAADLGTSISVWYAAPAEDLAPLAREAEDLLDAARRKYTADLRAAGAAVKLNDPSSLVELLMAPGQVSRAFLPALADALGVDLGGGSPLAWSDTGELRTALARQPKGEVEAMAKVAVHLLSTGDAMAANGRERWAKDEVERVMRERATEALTRAVEALPPDFGPGERGSQAVARLDAAAHAARAAVRPGAPLDADVPAALSALRAALADARAVRDERVPPGWDLDRMIEETEVFLRDHPGVLLTLTPDERFECRVGAVRANLKTARLTLDEVRAGVAEADEDMPLHLDALAKSLEACWTEVREGGVTLQPGGAVHAQLADASDFLSDARGEVETLFGERAAMEPVTPAKPAGDDPATAHAAHLAGNIREALAAAEMRGMTEEDEAHARRKLAKWVAQGREFVAANDEVDAPALLDALEAAEALLSGEVE